MKKIIENSQTVWGAVFSKQPTYVPDGVYDAWRTRAAIGIFFVAMIILIILWGTFGRHVLGSTYAVMHGSDQYVVSEVVDGDTVDIVNSSGQSQRVRLIGIDTPEMNYTGGDAECYAEESKAYLKTLLINKTVHIQTDESQGMKDKYDRYLYYIFLDGMNIGEELIENGYAREYTYDKPYKHQLAFRSAEESSKQAAAGMWSACEGANEGSAQPLSSSSESAIRSTTSAPAVSGKEIVTANESCDPNYSPCIPSVSYDLDCADINSPVRVIGTDHHRFDRDKDGFGCESN